MRKDLRYARRPDPMRRASLAAEIDDLQGRERRLLADRREAGLHLKACLDETERIEKEQRLDLAQLAALNADAREFGGSLPDPEAEKERVALQERFGRPGRIAESLTAAVERASSELTQVREQRKQLESDLLKEEAAAKELDEYELAQLRERAAANQVLSPVEKESLARAG
jgi:DNA repair exonuclease SbcCD ATPase subunit